MSNIRLIKDTNKEDQFWDFENSFSDYIYNTTVEFDINSMPPDILSVINPPNEYIEAISDNSPPNSK